MGKINNLCLKCKKKPFFNDVNKFCHSCFFEVIEKRVRRFVRGKNFFKKNYKVLFVDDSSAEAKVGKYLFNSIFKNFPLKMTVVKKQLSRLSPHDFKEYDKIIIPWNLDIDAEGFLLDIFNNTCQIVDDNCKFVKLLSSLTKEEVELFAKRKGFKFSKNNISHASNIIDVFEKKYPGTKFSIVRSKERLI